MASLAALLGCATPSPAAPPAPAPATVEPVEPVEPTEPGGPTLEVGGARLRVVIEGERGEMSEAEVHTWLARSATMVADYYGAAFRSRP